jgi:hypothetical protein
LRQTRTAFLNAYQTQSSVQFTKSLSLSAFQTFGRAMMLNINGLDSGSDVLERLEICTDAGLRGLDMVLLGRTAAAKASVQQSTIDLDYTKGLLQRTKVSYENAVARLKLSLAAIDMENDPRAVPAGVIEPPPRYSEFAQRVVKRKPVVAVVMASTEAQPKPLLGNIIDSEIELSGDATAPAASEIMNSSHHSDDLGGIQRGLDNELGVSVTSNDVVSKAEAEEHTDSFDVEAASLRSASTTTTNSTTRHVSQRQKRLLSKKIATEELQKVQQIHQQKLQKQEEEAAQAEAELIERARQERKRIEDDRIHAYEIHDVPLERLAMQLEDLSSHQLRYCHCLHQVAAHTYVVTTGFAASIDQQRGSFRHGIVSEASAAPPNPATVHGPGVVPSNGAGMGQVVPKLAHYSPLFRALGLAGAATYFLFVSLPDEEMRQRTSLEAFERDQREHQKEEERQEKRRELIERRKNSFTKVTGSKHSGKSRFSVITHHLQKSKLRSMKQAEALLEDAEEEN